MSSFSIRRNTTLGDQRLRGMLEYLLLYGSKMGGVPKTKLFKLVYLSDFSNYYFTGKSISGHVYKNRDYGPVPDALFVLVDEMKRAGDIKVEDGEQAQFHKLVVQPRHMGYLTEAQKQLLEKVCRYWRDKSTQHIVNFAHHQRPWFLTKKDEKIPYELILQEGHPFLPGQSAP